MTNLFRPEVLQQPAGRRLNGDVIVVASPSARLVSAFLVAVVALGLGFAATTSYARKETVQGWLSPQGGMIRVSARQGGRVEDLHVVENALVAEGQPLATLRLSGDIRGGGDLAAALDRGFDDEAVAAEAEGEAARARLAAETIQVEGRVRALERELQEGLRRIPLGEQRLELARAEVARAQTVADRGFLTRRELDARRSAALAAETELSQTKAGTLQLEREIGEARARLAVLPAELRAAEARLASVRAGLSQRRVRAESEGAYIATAPMAGAVVALPFERGQAVEAGAAVAVLTPARAPLEAELYLPSRAAGFVRPGQEVRLMYQAFPHQKFGSGRAVVTSVSSTVLGPGEVAIPGMQISEPVFRVRARLLETQVEGYGERIPLRPGMQLTADIVIDRRTLVEWLLDPLYAAGRRK